ncbi:hypothetical protein MSAN_00849500 [Mycena sanguinolenta]|uniref:Uncharacterized protein n=1 Tax=Mycena sanguinolenta TaxID=230812 RepID=A0A8H6Z1Z8_9AGAR|nr:hypothetical protein MSAN_00849500 [Mycena sanguinolenta]
MSAPLSLFKELTSLNPGYPVTQILADLITLVGHDVCLTKRNHHSVYLALSQARDVCNDINARIGQAKVWTDVETYMKMIAGIEQVLLDFSTVAEKEATEARFPGKATLQEDLAFIDNWRMNHTAFTKIFKDLYKPEYFKVSAEAFGKNIETIRKQDDLGLFKAMHLRINSTFDKLETISTDLPDHIFVYSMQFAMALEILISGRDSKLRARLQDSSLWALAKQGVDLVAQSATAGSTRDGMDEFSHKSDYRWRDHIGNARGVQSMSGCEKLATKFKENAQKAPTPEIYIALKTALDNTTNALKAAADVAYEPKQIFNFESEPAKSSFTTAENSVKACFEAYKLSHNEFGNGMNESRKSDKERIGALQTRFTQQKAEFSKTVTVVVKVKEPEQKRTYTLGKVKEPEQKRTYTVESDTTLSLIMWKEASAREGTERQAFYNKAYFQGSDNTTLTLDLLVKDLPGDAANKSVTLVA